MMRMRTFSEIAFAISTDCWAASVSRAPDFARPSATPSSARIVFGLAEHLRPTDSQPAVLVADENVLGDIEIGKQQRLLIDRGDAKPLRLGGAADRDRSAGQKHLAAIRLMHAGDDLDQRRFAGPVLAKQRVNFACVKGEGHVVERLGGVEALGDAANFQDRRGDCRSVGEPLRLDHVCQRPPVTSMIAPVT